MALSDRQERAYVHLCDLWRFVPTVDAGGPEDNAYTLAEAGVPCRFVTKASVDNPQAVALLESDDLITVDTLRLPEGTECESSWIAVQRTPGHGDLNQGWIVRGAPRRRVSAPDRPAGRVVAYTTKLPILPPEIRSHYGL